MKQKQIELGEIEEPIKNPEELKRFFEEGYYLVSCDASYKNFAGACSVQIKNKDKEWKVKSKKFNAKGRNEAEMKSVLFGIREIKKLKEKKKKVIFTNDNAFAIKFIRGEINPRQENITLVLNKIKNELCLVSFEYRFLQVRSKINKIVDREAVMVLKKKEVDINFNIKRRIAKIEKINQKSKRLDYFFENQKYFVKSENSDIRYEVSLEPLFCSCPYWMKNWSNKKEVILKIRGLPCKHICKIAEVTKKDIFEIFQRQINRRT